jgi:hypothetical protein
MSVNSPPHAGQAPERGEFVVDLHNGQRRLERWTGLTRFVTNPRIPLDNNAVSRMMARR